LLLSSSNYKGVRLPVAPPRQPVIAIRQYTLMYQSTGSVQSPASSFPVGFVGADDEESQYDLRAKELNQGRAAQMGMLALMVHDKLGNVDDLLGWLPSN